MNPLRLVDVIRFAIASIGTMLLGIQYVLYFAPRTDGPFEAAAFLIGLFALPSLAFMFLIKVFK